MRNFFSGTGFTLCAFRRFRTANRLKPVLFFVAGVLLAASPALAEHTRWWRQSSFEEFDKGTAKGVALRSDGKLFLAPRFAQFADANLAYLLALRADSKGNLYTTETYQGRRVQKFVYKGLGPVTKKEQGTVWPTTKTQ